MAPVSSRSQFEAELIRRILARVYVPGAKLPSERQLSIQSGLSRTLIREVLRRIDERGLIEVIPARGAFVREPKWDQLSGAFGSAALQQRATARDLVEARVAIESQAARGAAGRANDRDLQRLRELVDDFDAAHTTIQRVQCDLTLHAHIAQLSGNPVLGLLFGAITPLVVDVQLRSLADPAVLSGGGPIHHEIIEAIGRHDAEAAAEAMSRHVGLALELYGKDLDERLNDLAVARLAPLLDAEGVQQQL